MRLADLVGQEAARAALLGAVARGHVAHAYLFEGPPGVGKRNAALGLAMALDCPRSPPEETRSGTAASAPGCGVCDVCRRIEAGLHPDVPTFGPSGPGGQIVIEDARTILSLARTRPHEAPARVIIIDDADALNPNAANSLLKTLEEPLAGNHLVLCTTAPERLLPTIRSRAQRVRFRALAGPELLTLAAKHGVAPDRAEIAAALADGSAARLLEAARPDTADPAADPVSELAATLASLREAVATPAAAPVFDFAAGLGGEKARDQLAQLLRLTGRLYRDALHVAAGAPELAVLTEASGAGAAVGPLARLGTNKLNRALAAIVDTQLALAVNVNPTLALERLLLALKREERRAA